MFENVRANSSADLSNTLIGELAGNVWRIAGTNSGRISDEIDFQGFANLIGGTGVDSFIFDFDDQITGLIDGNSGTDIDDELNIVGLDDSASVSLDRNIDADINIVGIENILAADNGNELIANQVRNEWIITGADEGPC